MSLTYLSLINDKLAWTMKRTAAKLTALIITSLVKILAMGLRIQHLDALTVFMYRRNVGSAVG